MIQNTDLGKTECEDNFILETQIQYGIGANINDVAIMFKRLKIDRRKKDKKG